MHAILTLAILADQLVRRFIVGLISASPGSYSYFTRVFGMTARRNSNSVIAVTLSPMILDALMSSFFFSMSHES